MSERKLSSFRIWEYENSDKVHFKPENMYDQEWEPLKPNKG
jgi:hypothetical protein